MSEEQSIPLANDVVFGDVRTKERTQKPVPPCSNGHYAVQRVPPPKNDSSSHSSVAPTNVYVQLDVMLDMQEHGAEDTSVELGGVLLGYRGSQDNGEPYVVINDSLRARHYKATRGSFTFTHETWADLSSRRAALPESTEIVGWYHTHPGWGVFLSDMDVFICDHFFSHPDDVALVIDPTSGDTGLFVRRGAKGRHAPQRLPNYHLYAHRKCRELLAEWANYFSGGILMSSPNAVFPGRSSTPVILSTTAGDSMANRALMLLAIAFIGSQLLLGTAFFFSQRTGPPNALPVDSQDLKIREALVDEMLTKIAVEGPEGVGQSYRELALRNAELRSSNLGLLSRVQDLQTSVQQISAENQKINLEIDTLRDRLADAEKITGQRTVDNARSRANHEAGLRGTTWWQSTWFLTTCSAVVAALLSGLGVFYSMRNGLFNSR